MQRLLVGGIVGCAPVPLDEVPIVGGSDEQQALVREVAADFEAAAGEGRLRISKFVLDEVGEGDGVGSVTRTVTLSYTASSPLSVGLSARDALARALVQQDRLQKVDPEPVLAAAGLWCGEGVGTGCGDPEEDFSLAVGWLATQGPYWAADVDRAVCDHPDDLDADPALTRDIARWMLDQVWSAFVLPDPVELDPADAIPVAVDGIDAIIPTEDPTVARVATVGGDSVHVGLYDGAVVQSDAAAVASAVDAPVGLGLLWTAPGQVVGWPAGPALAIGNWAPSPLQVSSGTRALAYGEGAWRFLDDGCADGLEHVFTADEQTWIERGGAWTWVGRHE